MAAEAGTVTNLSLDWTKALKSKVVPPHGVRYKYPLIAFNMKERELVVIHLQKQRILFGSVEKAAGKCRGREAGAAATPCCALSTQHCEVPGWTASSGVGQVQGGQILQVLLLTGAVWC